MNPEEGLDRTKNQESSCQDAVHTGFQSRPPPAGYNIKC
jgi:hypothetical protein